MRTCPGHSLARYALRPYREPDVPRAPFVAVDPERDGVHFQINFPLAARAGRERLTYWLTGDEPIELDVQLGLGRRTGALYEARSVRSSVLIDGVQVMFRERGSDRPMLSTDHPLAPGEVSRFRLTISAQRLAHGAHSITLVHVTPTGERFPSWSFTALKDGTEFSAREPAAGGEVRPRSLAWASGLSLPPAPQPVDGRIAAPAGGRLAVRIAVQPSSFACLEVPRGFVLLAFLDGAQVPLGSLGRAPHVELAYAQRFEAGVELVGLPVDGKEHVLALFAAADGVYMEAPADRISAAAELPQQIGRLRWR